MPGMGGWLGRRSALHVGIVSVPTNKTVPVQEQYTLKPYSVVAVKRPCDKSSVA